jgi:hypothetical protein
MALLNLACASGGITTGAGTAGAVTTAATGFLPGLPEGNLLVSDTIEDFDAAEDAALELELLTVDDFDDDATDADELDFELTLLDEALGL